MTRRGDSKLRKVPQHSHAINILAAKKRLASLKKVIYERLATSTMSTDSNWIWNFDGLLKDLRDLHEKCDRRICRLDETGYRLWARGVLFGIEMGQNRISEYRMRSPAELTLLLNHWEWRTRKHLREATSVTDSTRGIDFGIHLVITRVRKYLRQSFPPESR
jgi:hypothetical protein